MTIFASIKGWAKAIRRDVIALWIASRDPRVPVSAKVVAACVAAYALSPIDLIPDVIPVLGLLDDLVIVPLGILLAVRLIPAPLMAEFRQAALLRAERTVSTMGAALVIVVWIATAALIGWLLWRRV